MKYILILSLAIMYIAITKDLWIDMFERIKKKIEKRKEEKRNK